MPRRTSAWSSTIKILICVQLVLRRGERRPRGFRFRVSTECRWRLPFLRLEPAMLVLVGHGYHRDAASTILDLDGECFPLDVDPNPDPGRSSVARDVGQ